MDHLCQLKEIFQKIYQFDSKLKKNFDLSINEVMILCSLLKNDNCSGELASELGVTPGRMSKILSSLENKQLISRSIGKSDKRQMIFQITEQGKLKMNEIKKSNIEVPDFRSTLGKEN